MKNHNENTHAATDKWLLSVAIILVVMLCLIACCFAVFFYVNPPIILTDPNSGQEQMIIFPNAAGELTSTPFLPIPTATQTPTPTPTPTPLPTPTRQPTMTPLPSAAQINGVYGNGLKRYSQLPAQIGGEGCKPLQRLMFVVAYHVSDLIFLFHSPGRMGVTGGRKKN